MRHPRTEPRRVAVCRISVGWVDDYGNPRTESAYLEDRSLSGVGLSLTNPIPIGTKVTLRERGRDLAGVVRYCRLGGLKYQIGIHLDQVNGAWSKFGGAS